MRGWATGEWTVVVGPANGRPSINTDGMGWETRSGDGIWLCDDPEDDCGQYRAEDAAEAAHIVLHGPAHELAAITANRQLLELHTGPHACPGYTPPPTDTSGLSVDELIDAESTVDACSTVLLLAAPFASHLGYYERWRP